MKKQFIEIAKDFGIDMADSNLPEDIRRQYLVLIGQHRKAFAKHALELVGTNIYPHTIHMGNAAETRHAQTKPSSTNSNRGACGTNGRTQIDRKKYIGSSVVLVKKKKMVPGDSLLIILILEKSQKH